MAKITLNWKTPSEKKMAQYVGELENDKKRDFAKVCIEVKNGKNVINKSRAKKWLVDKCDSTGDIEWLNRPKNVRPMSAADEIASWLNL